MSSKIERDTIIGSNQPPIWRRLQNQKIQKLIRDRAKESYGSRNDKAAKSKRRKWEKEQLLIDQELGMRLLRSRRKMQFSRALDHVLVEGNAAPLDMDYIASHGKVVDSYISPKGTEVTITIVNFTPPSPKQLF